MTRRPSRLVPMILCLTLISPSIARADRFRHAFKEALTDPATWIPAAGAIVFAASGADESVSAWAAERTPLFGSRDSARRWSTDLRNATHMGMMVTAGLRTDALEVPVWGTQFGVGLIGRNAAGPIKGYTGRTRPDGSDDESFPSGHATAAFTYAGLASRNLRASRLPPAAQRGIRIGLTTLAAGTAWGRIEGGAHYPSDVLAGAAIGNFLAVFLNEAILPNRTDMRIGMALDAEGGSVWLSWER